MKRKTDRFTKFKQKAEKHNENEKGIQEACPLRLSTYKQPDDIYLI